MAKTAPTATPSSTKAGILAFLKALIQELIKAIQKKMDEEKKEKEEKENKEKEEKEKKREEKEKKKEEKEKKKEEKKKYSKFGPKQLEFAKKLEADIDAVSELAELAIENSIGNNERIDTIIKRLDSFGKTANERLASEGISAELLEDMMNSLNKELQIAQSRLNREIAISETTDITDNLARLLMGETIYPEESLADTDKKFIAVYKNKDGDIIIAVNKNGNLSREVSPENFSNDTQYYKMIKPTRGRPYFENIKTDMVEQKKALMQDCSYVGDDCSIAKKVITSFAKVRMTTEDVPAIMFGDLGVLPKNAVDASKNLLSLKKLISAADELREKITMEADPDKQKETLNDYIQKFDKAMDLPEIIKTDEVIQAIADLKEITIQLAKVDFNDPNETNQAMKHLIKLKAQIQGTINAVTEAQNVELFEFDREYVELIGKEQLQKKDRYNDKDTADSLSKGLCEACQDSFRKIGLTDMIEAKKSIERTRTLFNLIKEPDKIIQMPDDETQKAIYISKDKIFRVYNEETQTLFIIDTSKGKCVFTAYKDIDDINAEISEENGLLLADFREHPDKFEQSFYDSLGDRSIIKLAESPIITAIAQAGAGIPPDVWGDVISKAHAESIEKAKSLAESRGETFTTERDIVFEKLVSAIEERNKAYNRSGDKKEPYSILLTKGKVAAGNIEIGLPNGDKCYLNFDQSGFLDKSIKYKIDEIDGKRIDKAIDLKRGDPGQERATRLIGDIAAASGISGTYKYARTSKMMLDIYNVVQEALTDYESEHKQRIHTSKSKRTSLEKD